MSDSDRPESGRQWAVLPLPTRGLHGRSELSGETTVFLTRLSRFLHLTVIDSGVSEVFQLSFGDMLHEGAVFQGTP